MQEVDSDTVEMVVRWNLQGTYLAHYKPEHYQCIFIIIIVVTCYHCYCYAGGGL